MESFFDASFNSEMFRQIMTVYLGVMLALVLCSLVQYVLRSLSLFTIAKRRGISNYGLAWVPVACFWTLGSVADGYDGSRGIRRKWRTVLLTLCLVQIACIIFAYYRGLIIDEAHRLYDAVQGVCGMEVSEKQVKLLLNDLRNARMNTLANTLSVSFSKLFRTFFSQAGRADLAKPMR